MSGSHGGMGICSACQKRHWLGYDRAYALTQKGEVMARLLRLSDAGRRDGAKAR